ncbi:transient receptor potential cation channel subfamily V member 6-like [Hyperolius riggenbachi]|uniref:transient receptor potential cation channel subfamily V member 6-like n=1 Tax=Hyperolius riggenbachi TaxID=752182 RepID=UPI0035A3CC6E
MFYFGEHILAFACCVGDAEIAKLLLDHGADLWAQDCWGNTILHILILQPNANLSCEMFDFLLSQDPEPDGKPLYEIPNGKGLTPLKLAAAEGNVVMFQHLIQKKRKIQRTYGPVTTMIYDMSEIDSWEDPQSVLQLITSSNKSEAHKILNSSPVKELLQKKWRRTGRPYVWFLGTVHTLYMICVSLSFANRPLKPLTGVKTNPMDITVAVQKTLQESYVTTEDHLRLAGEIVTLLGAVVLLLVEISQVQQFGLKRVLVHIFWSDPFHLLRMSYSIMILVVLMMRLTNTNGEVIPMSLALIFGWCYIMYFARGFQMIGPFTITIQKLFSVILVKVCCIMAVVVIGYSTALYVALQQSDPAALGSFYPFMICTISTYQLFTNILNGPANYSVDLPELYSFLYGSFCVVAFLLLFNLFLGIMGDTQNEMSKIKEEIWKAQITAASITMEQKLPKHWMFASRSEEHDLCGRHYLIVEERKWKPIKQENNDSSEESDDDDDDLPTPAEE